MCPFAQEMTSLGSPAMTTTTVALMTHSSAILNSASKISDAKERHLGCPAMTTTTAPLTTPASKFLDHHIRTQFSDAWEILLKTSPVTTGTLAQSMTFVIITSRVPFFQSAAVPERVVLVVATSNA
jgi:hypothetical protein